MTDPLTLATAAAPPPTDARWADVLDRVVDRPDLLALHAQPIVDITTGAIAGYEMLSRFTGPWRAPPDVWFAAADVWGHNAALQARVLRTALAARDLLPPDTFLTVNIDPHLLAHHEVAAVLTGTSDLTRVVLELTEHTQVRHGSLASDVLDHVRRSGGMLALDDVGTGYAGLSQLLTLRPDIVKLDREFIQGIDANPVKTALVEVLGDLVGRMDGWVLAEGIETRSELDAVIRLGVPLAQGWALARPAATMLEALPTPLVDHIRATVTRRSSGGHVASLVRPIESGASRDDEIVALDNAGRVVAVRSTGGEWLTATLVAPTTSIVEAARRAMTRELRHRYAPLVCTDGRGRVIGTVPVDHLVLALCSMSSSATGGGGFPQAPPEGVLR